MTNKKADIEDDLMRCKETRAGLLSIAKPRVTREEIFDICGERYIINKEETDNWFRSKGFGVVDK